MFVEQVSEVFEQRIPARLAANPELGKRLAAVYKFVVTGDDGGTWVVDTAKGSAVDNSTDASPGCTVILSPGDLKAIMNGELSVQTALTSGRLRVEGSVNQAAQLAALLV